MPMFGRTCGSCRGLNISGCRRIQGVLGDVERILSDPKQTINDDADRRGGFRLLLRCGVACDLKWFLGVLFLLEGFAGQMGVPASGHLYDMRFRIFEEISSHVHLHMYVLKRPGDIYGKTDLHRMRSECIVRSSNL